MIRPDISARRIGREEQPVAVIDGFHPDPDILRAKAIATRFGPARHHYPGVRASLPRSYFADVRASLATVLEGVFGARGGARLIDASFSIVTTPASALSLAQRLPHVDAIDPAQIAIVHYLAPADDAGTAFFRHRATGHESVDADRSEAYLATLNREIADGPSPAGYVGDGGKWFERIDAVEARYNRAVLYRGTMLHSGDVARDAVLPADPATGRLTVTAFLSIR